MPSPRKIFNVSSSQENTNHVEFLRVESSFAFRFWCAKRGFVEGGQWWCGGAAASVGVKDGLWGIFIVACVPKENSVLHKICVKVVFDLIHFKFPPCILMSWGVVQKVSPPPRILLIGIGRNWFPG